tara:strand:+ start:592 stop:1212 length:621 start_codon:yes stop_codon:yes gene_type:complete
MAGATIRLVGTLITKLRKLSEKQDTIDAFLKSKTAKNPANKKAKNIAEKRKKKVDEEHVKIKKQINQQVAEMDKPKPPKVSIVKVQKNKRKTPDRSVVMDNSGKMGSAVRGARYKGKKEAFEKLVDRVEDLRAQGKIKEANKIMNSRKFKDLADWDADYAGRKSGGPIVKKPMGGKVYKNTVSRKHGGAIGVGSALRGFGKGYKKG